jgi:branched-chain amino acid transport system permease protein
VSTVVLLALTGLGLGALYFLVASGLSLIYGLMGVLNFAHGAFLTIGAYASWWVDVHLASSPAGARYVAAVLAGTVAGGVAALLTEMLIVRRLYERHIEQVLVTVGLALAVGALVAGVWGQDARSVPTPAWLTDTTSVLGASVPNNRLVAIVLAIAVLGGLRGFLRGTRYGLIIRAGVENRAMVTALGIDVRRAFTLVFVIGGLVAGLGGVLAAAYFGSVDPDLGASMLIFAFITVVIGGLGSITGSAVAAVLVALLQQFANYYAASGVGDLSVVLLLAVVLLARPRGLMGGPA